MATMATMVRLALSSPVDGNVPVARIADVPVHFVLPSDPLRYAIYAIAIHAPPPCSLCYHCFL